MGSTTKHQIQYQSKFIGQKIQGKFIEFLTFGILLLHINMTFEIKFIWLLLFLLINISSIKGEEILNDESLDTTGGGVVLKLEHSFDHGKTYSSRGSITIHSLRSGTVSIQQNELNSEEKSELQNLCDIDGLYLVRAATVINNLESFRSAAHSCNLIESGLSDIFNIQLDWRHKIAAVQLSTPSVPNKVPLSTLSGFKTRAYVQHMEAGPAPDTATFIQREEEAKLKKQRGESQDNRSFFAKYWMYIVPVVLVMVLSGGGQEGGGGR